MHNQILHINNLPVPESMLGHDLKLQTITKCLVKLTNTAMIHCLVSCIPLQ